MSKANDSDQDEPLLDHDKRTLAENYEKTDIAVEYIEQQLGWYGFGVEHVGRDDRHNTGTPVYGGMPDLQITSVDGNVCGFIEVKAKSHSYNDWMGKLNKHHWEKYLNGCTIDRDGKTDGWPGAQGLSTPIFVAMVCVNENEQTVTDEFYIPVQSDDQIEYSFSAQGGKRVVSIDEQYWNSWNDMYIALMAGDRQ